MSVSTAAKDIAALPEGFVDRVEALVGSKGWSQDKDELHGYETSSWGGGAGRAAILLKPADTKEVSALLALCNEMGVPVTPQGGNTGLVGGGVPDESGRFALLSLRRLDAILDIDTIGDTITVGAGAVLERVHEAAATENRLFALNLGARGSCVIGGNLSTNAGGLNVIRYGMSRDLVLGLEVVLADGTVWDGLRAVRKDNTGYDLKQLFIGSEGTLGVITAACLKLSPMPRERHTAWLGLRSPDDALKLLRLCRERLGETINAFELLHKGCVDTAVAHRGVAQPIGSDCPWHVVLEASWTFTDGLAERLEAVVAEAFEQDLVQDGTIAQNESQRATLWDLRDAQAEVLPLLGLEHRHDITVPIGSIPEFIRVCGERMEALIPGVRAWPFGHVGDGNLHYNVIQPEGSDRAWFYGLKAEVQKVVFDVTQSLHGSISAEHGIGRFKRDELATRYPLDVALMRRIKATLDPKGTLNPGATIA
ncbi:FAD-binding oxidoreductase [Marinivivus vitaminiproducens]|uniref:FAD-binding oxidoreductase n=1 Tax=Marinivivus vitaminiproducens TaxID=3035935 RepID=UPI00279DC9C7|nr:FAD-binding oxidoreductase [Geminicoccaceae bacterium SCSIO 64248]